MSWPRIMREMLNMHASKKRFILLAGYDRRILRVTTFLKCVPARERSENAVAYFHDAIQPSRRL